jgi:hypothetical protein
MPWIHPPLEHCYEPNGKPNWYWYWRRDRDWRPNHRHDNYCDNLAHKSKCSPNSHWQWRNFQRSRLL